MPNMQIYFQTVFSFRFFGPKIILNYERNSMYSMFRQINLWLPSFGYHGNKEVQDYKIKAIL